MDFRTKLINAWAKNDSLVCVGLDPDMDKLSVHLKSDADSFFSFNKAIIDATADLVCAYKPNSAFYEALGPKGIVTLQKTCHYIAENYPDIPVLLDFKRGDIGNTNNHYASFAFKYLGVDAVTIAPYMGREANEAFLAYRDKGIIVLCRTSNPGSGEFQDLEIGGQKLYQIVAKRVMDDWNVNNNCLLVVGSPYPAELAELRQTLGNDVTFLIPGIGAQGGDVEATVKAGVNSGGTGAIINSSRGIIFASSDKDFADAARTETLKLRTQINAYRGV